MLPGFLMIGFLAVVYSGRPVILIPLIGGCFLVAVAAPIAAFKRILHIPAYCGIALFSLVFGLFAGNLSGRQVPGSLPGLCFALVFFLAMAACIGSVMAIFFYRPPEI